MSRLPDARRAPSPRSFRSLPHRRRQRGGGDWRLRAGWGLGAGLLIGAFAVWLLARHPLGASLERSVMDGWFALRGGRPVRDVAILSVDEDAQKRWGREWSTQGVARLLRLVKRGGARGVVLAFPALADEPFTPAQERLLSAALRDEGRVYVGIDSVGRDSAERLRALSPPVARLLKAARGAGHLALFIDPTGRPRSVPLQIEGRGRVWKPLCLTPPNGVPSGVPGEMPPVSSRNLVSGVGAALLLNFPHETPDPALPYTRSPFLRVTVGQALDKPEALKAVRDRWVVMGPEAGFSLFTPLGGRVSPLETQAVALDNALTKSFLRPALPLWSWLLALLPCAVVGALTTARRLVWSLAMALMCACGAAFLSFAAWNADIWLAPTPAWLGIAFTFFAGAFARTRWHERQATRIHFVVDALSHGSELIAAQKNSVQLLPRVLAWAENTLRARSSSVLLLDPDGQTLRFACATGPKASELMKVTLRLGQGIAGWVAQEGVPAVVNETAHDYRFDEDVDRRTGFSTRSILCVPLRVSDRMLGVIEVINRRDGQPFDAMDAELLSAVANQAALVIENARLYERLNQRVEESESELARANVRLQTEKTLLQTVLQSMTDGVVVTDRRGRVQLMNAAASALLPELGPQVLGRPLCDGVPELRAEPGVAGEPGAVLLLRGDVDAPRVIEAHTAPLLTGALSVDGAAPDGTPDSAVVPHAALPPGEALPPGAASPGAASPFGGSIVVFSDVTEARNVERAKSDFVAFVAHEMRSPLTSISGFSAMLARMEDTTGEANPSRARFLGIIHNESERLTRLINNLLDVARIEAGRGVELSPAQWEAAPLLEAAAESQRSFSSRHHLVCAAEPDLPPLFADRDKALQVLINLVSNAQKYAPGGTVTLRACRESEGWVRFCVCDQGPGIAPEERALLFGRFERGERRGPQPVGGAGSRAKPTGTGLGLFLSKYLVEAHGGRIWIDPHGTGGATFCFTLPTCDAEIAPLDPPQQSLPGL